MCRPRAAKARCLQQRLEIRSGDGAVNPHHSFIRGGSLRTKPGSSSTYTYETVSIHPSDPNQTGAHIGPGPGGGLTTRNTSVKDLIVVGWNIPDYRIIDMPSWASSEHFDVTFTPDKQETAFAAGMKSAEFEAVLQRQAQRIQAVLQDRFGLTLHTEGREMSLYSLTVSKGGSKLTPSSSPMSDRINGGKIPYRDRVHH